MSELAHLATDLTEAEALDLTDRIARTADHLAALIQSAWRGRIWIALGYGSWNEWTAECLPGLRLPSGDRQSIVAELGAVGMSTRAIAAAVGVHHSTVADDLAAVGNPTPAVVGLDGKDYTRPIKVKVVRKPTPATDPIKVNLVRTDEVADALEEVDDTGEAGPRWEQRDPPDANRLFESMAVEICGIADGLRMFPIDWAAVDPDVLREWEDDLNPAIEAIFAFSREMSSLRFMNILRFSDEAER